MTILTRHVMRSVLMPTLLVLFLLIALRFLFEFLNELEDVGEAEYTAAKAMLYAALYIPYWLAEMLPMSALIGTVMGLGVLSSNSELTAMRAAAVSPLQIGRATLYAAAILILAGAVISEFVVPKTTTWAANMRMNARAPGMLYRAGATGIWLRSTDDYVFFRRVLMDRSAEQVYVFTFSAPQKLAETLYANRAEFLDDGRWRLVNGIHTRFDGQAVHSEPFDEVFWKSELAPEHLQIVQAKPEELSGFGLFSYIQYLTRNGLDAAQYGLEFWRKVAQPLNLFAMVLAGIASIFGPLRSVTVSARILTGVAVGLSFNYLGQIFGSVSLVYHMPPILGAFLPPLVFLMGALFLLRRAK